MVCRNICQRLYTSTQISGHYSAGAKYCQRCEYYLITTELFCECCGMRLRGNPAARIYKEKFRAKKKLTPNLYKSELADHKVMPFRS
jgi:hypothetical protein